MEQHRERFVWPPVQTDADAEAASISRPLPQPRVPVRSTASAPGFRTRARAAILEIERAWLGLETPPLKDRMADEGWSPDPVDAYCRRCGSTVGLHEADDTGCSHCRGVNLPWDRIVRLGPYAGVLRRMVLEVKFTRWRRLGHDLGLMLGRSLLEVMEAEKRSLDRVILVPIPVSTRRRLARGIDHALVIARGVAAELKVPVVRALSRKHGPSQARVPGRLRARNVEGVIRPRIDVSGWDVILIDDVTTTRATLRAGCRGLRSGCKSLGDRDEGAIWTAVLGVTPAPGGGKGK